MRLIGMLQFIHIILCNVTCNLQIIVIMAPAPYDHMTN